MNQMPQATALYIPPGDFIPKSSKRKDWFSPRNAPRKATEEKAALRMEANVLALDGPQKLTQRGKPMPKTVNGLIVRLLREGSSQAEISRMTGVSRKKIREIARRLNIPTTDRQYCEHYAEEIRRLFDKGLSYRAISLHLGMSRGAAGRFIEKKGWTR
jgi:DNA invertase Pin-like site-specific DNA recombinase